MWKSFSLPVRLGLLLGSIFLAALILGAVALRSFAVDQLIDENQPAIRSAGMVAGALNNTLANAAEPDRTLAAFVEGLGSADEALRFEKAGAPSPKVRASAPGRAPDWFAGLIGTSAINARFPVLIGGREVGELLFEPDLTADVFEKWISFLSLAFAGIGVTVVTIFIAYMTLNRALRSLRELAGGLTRLRQGDYRSILVCTGAPEIRKSCEEVNALATTLTELEGDNRRLLRKIVSLQDDERRDIARELHDELGPLLFGIRANSVALLESADGEQAVQRSAQRVMESAEALQQANRKILDRLRPLHIEELGLDVSIQSLVRDARSHLPELKVTSDIAPSLKVDSVMSQTIYRVIQESVTNVLRHARATELGVRTSSEREHILVEISDDGVGITPDIVFGRGLTGMRERVRALGGTLQLGRESGRTFVRCRLPVAASE